MAASIYLDLASRVSQRDPKLSSFWLDMAMHEKQHAGLLQFCVRDGLFVADLPDASEIQKLAEFFKRLEKRAADPNLTVEEAFRLAIEMESAEINGIYCHLTTTLHSSMYLLQRKIVTLLPSHIDELVKAARRFGVRDRASEELNRPKEECSPNWGARKYHPSTSTSLALACFSLWANGYPFIRFSPVFQSTQRPPDKPEPRQRQDTSQQARRLASAHRGRFC